MFASSNELWTSAGSTGGAENWATGMTQAAGDTYRFGKTPSTAGETLHSCPHLLLLLMCVFHT